jgi:hypothetical protein
MGEERKKNLRRRLSRAALTSPLYLVMLVLLFGANLFRGNWALLVPIYGVVVILALYYFRWIKGLRRKEFLLAGFCPRCEYDLTGNISGTCPECGTSTDQAQSAS